MTAAKKMLCLFEYRRVVYLRVRSSLPLSRPSHSRNPASFDAAFELIGQLAQLGDGGLYGFPPVGKIAEIPKDQVPGDKVFFPGVDGGPTYRAMVGYSTRANPTTGVSAKRYWHYAIQARPQVHPTFAYIFKSHILFTSDGKTIWESKKKLAPARRSQCKSWWNDEWRDRALAAATFLCDGTDKITLTLGNKAILTIPPMPVLFCSPVSYTDPQLLRFSEDDETADDYGRDSRDEDAFEDDPEGGAE
jgi:hypothetical protein